MNLPTTFFLKSTDHCSKKKQKEGTVMAVKLKSLAGVQSTTVSLTTDLKLKIEEDILSGKFRKGDKLVEQAICDEYEVSRTPVREALSQLEAEGLVESIPNRGCFVTGISSEEMDDILVLRKIYEVQATMWAIDRITDEEMEELEENFEFMEFYTMKKDVEKMLNINASFHQMIYRASHNRMLEQMLSSYQLYVKYATKYAGDDTEYLDELLKEHRAIYQAFIDKDPAAGGDAMAHHMDMSMARHRR